MSSSTPPGLGGLVRTDLIHSRCGRPAREHPYPASPTIACPFPELPLPGFAVAPPAPRVRVVGLPDTVHLPGDVLEALDHLARVCRTAYGMGVEVMADDDLDEVRSALETIRRRLDL